MERPLSPVSVVVSPKHDSYVSRMVVVNLDELEVGVRGPRLESSVQLGRHKLLAPQLVRPRCQAGIGLSSCGGF